MKRFAPNEKPIWIFIKHVLNINSYFINKKTYEREFDKLPDWLGFAVWYCMYELYDVHVCVVMNLSGNTGVTDANDIWTEEAIFGIYLSILIFRFCVKFINILNHKLRDKRTEEKQNVEAQMGLGWAGRLWHAAHFPLQHLWCTTLDDGQKWLRVWDEITVCFFSRL